jgi:AGCS family alanine or glycine:cation symporter
MAFPNLVALILLSGVVARETKKFFEKLEGKKN